jgi:hypothetical protein
MIVKILQKSATFKAVRYNTGKVEKDRGELLMAKNFGALEGLENLRPQDYINYLEAVSARSSRTKYPQFHVAISTKGRGHSKEELADIARQWMEGMGYGEQPYLLIYHKDTANNHVHLVSTRVGRDGKKISDRYEKLRAYRVLNRIMGEDTKQTVTDHLQKALGYSFSTRAQFMMLLEAQGYTLTLKDGIYAISKYGRELAAIDLATVDTKIAQRQKDKGRVTQLRAIIQKYRDKHGSSLQITASGYHSALAAILQEKFGIQVLFHGKDGKQPHGYTIIDRPGKAVYKGGEIMPLAEFIAAARQTEALQLSPKRTHGTQPAPAAIHNEAWEQASDRDATDRDAPEGNGTGTDTQLPAHQDAEPVIVLPQLDINISDDIDDEAILGRNRRRKRKARTNTR